MIHELSLANRSNHCTSIATPSQSDTNHFGAGVVFELDLLEISLVTNLTDSSDLDQYVSHWFEG
ncbi:hypothetical protein [Prochlorococcus marinus]|uniref:hypothetical protein n=1 Tax=Prochlorococcus marinus TaxID=1219 RepID=UPI0022B4EA94|nr:hypothetical protein [Prochlorococcus marinus]